MSCFSLVAYSNLPWLDFKAFRFFLFGLVLVDMFAKVVVTGGMKGVFQVWPGLQNSGVFAVSVALGVDVVRLDLIT